MNGPGLGDEPGRRMPGKEYIVAAVVIFSSLSFTLGYFVGKSGREKKDVPPAAEAVATPVQAPAAPENQNVKPPDAGQVQPPVSSAVQEKVAAPEEPKKPEEPRKEAPKKVQAADAGFERKKDITAPEKKEKTPVSGSSTASKTASARKDPVYTVQISALRDEGEAENLRAKYMKKGYKVFITSSTDKNGEKIYKVRAGEFSNRKDADKLAHKLKKADAKHAFTTTKNE